MPQLPGRDASPFVPAPELLKAGSGQACCRPCRAAVSSLPSGLIWAICGSFSSARRTGSNAHHLGRIRRTRPTAALNLFAPENPAMAHAPASNKKYLSHTLAEWATALRYEHLSDKAI